MYSSLSFTFAIGRRFRTIEQSTPPLYKRLTKSFISFEIACRPSQSRRVPAGQLAPDVARRGHRHRRASEAADASKHSQVEELHQRHPPRHPLLHEPHLLPDDHQHRRVRDQPDVHHLHGQVGSLKLPPKARNLIKC